MGCKSIKTDNDTTSKVFNLAAENELRLEIKANSQVSFELKQGSAEIFGTELVINKKYQIPQDGTIAVFTWYGCILEVRKLENFTYVSDDTPMIIYTNIHSHLEQARQQAEANGSKGPTVLICGRRSVGKSTLCHILLNYSVRTGRRPVFVDLDVGQGSMSVPGTIGASMIEKVADVENGFSYQSPLIYHYGHTSPGKNMDLYMSLISRLATDVNIRAGNNRRISISGTFINTCGWLPKNGHKFIIHAINVFNVDVVLVIDQDRLHYELSSKLADIVTVLKIPKSGGANIRSEKEYAETQNNRIHEYFYGFKKRWYPYALKLKFSDIKVYNIDAPMLPESCLPLATKDDDNQTKVSPISIGTNLLYRVLSVSFASDLKEILDKNVAGFICVTGVNMENRTLTVLSPQFTLPPKAILLMSDVQYMDSY